MHNIQDITSKRKCLGPYPMKKAFLKYRATFKKKSRPI